MENIHSGPRPLFSEGGDTELDPGENTSLAGSTTCAEDADPMIFAIERIPSLQISAVQEAIPEESLFRGGRGHDGIEVRSEVGKVQGYVQVPGFQVVVPRELCDDRGSLVFETQGASAANASRDAQQGPSVTLVQGDFLIDPGTLLIDVPADGNVPYRSVRDRVFRSFPGLKDLIFQKSKRGKTGIWGRSERFIHGKRKLVYFVISRNSRNDEAGPDDIGYFLAVRDMTDDMVRQGVKEVATLLPPLRGKNRLDYQLICNRFATAFAGKVIRVRIYRP
jgi:hypothetical protein